MLLFIEYAYRLPTPHKTKYNFLPCLLPSNISSLRQGLCVPNHRCKWTKFNKCTKIANIDPLGKGYKLAHSKIIIVACSTFVKFLSLPFLQPDVCYKYILATGSLCLRKQYLTFSWYSPGIIGMYKRTW